MLLDYNLTILLMNNADLPPHWLKPAALAVMFSAIGAVTLILVLVLLGIADPKPLGKLTLDDNQPIELSTTAGHTIYQPALNVVQCPCTIETTMQQADGAPTAAYGLWWRTNDALTVTALNGNAYYAVFDDSFNYQSEWQRFPWLLPQTESNRLRIDLNSDGTATLRLNDEVAASFTWSTLSPIEVGFYAQTTEGITSVRVNRLRIWSSNP